GYPRGIDAGFRRQILRCPRAVREQSVGLAQATHPLPDEDPGEVSRSPRSEGATVLECRDQVVDGDDERPRQGRGQIGMASIQEVPDVASAPGAGTGQQSAPL